jgi:hypothetical protein
LIPFSHDQTFDFYSLGSCSFFEQAARSQGQSLEGALSQDWGRCLGMSPLDSFDVRSFS